jgi:hypothetical protein
MEYWRNYAQRKKKNLVLLATAAAARDSAGSSCQQQQQQGQGEIIHIIRYPDLGTRLGITVDDINDIIPDSVLEYQTQKLQEVGYRDINIVNTTDTGILVHYQTGPAVPIATAPAIVGEMTYNSNSTPGEMRRGYFFLTATNVTPPNIETITGYSIFYEGASGATAATAEETTGS